MRFARLLAVPAAAAMAVGAVEAGAEPSEQKVELIRQLLALSGGEAAAEQITETVLATIHARYPTLVDEVLKVETGLEEAQREALRAHLAEFDPFAATFRERLPQRIDLDRVLESVYVPLYDAHFSEAEIREIVVFYSTPTGRKVVEVLPALHQQGMQSTVPRVQPVVLALLSEILAERANEFIQ